MRKLKKVVAVTAAAAMVVSLAACSSQNNPGGAEQTGSDPVQSTAEDTTKEINGYNYTIKGDMTTEEIELTYFTFDDKETCEYLAARFMELYPNIHVSVTTAGENNDYMTTLGTLVTNKTIPDIIMYTDVDTTLYNKYLADISEYWNNDPETANLADTVATAGLGTFDSGHQLAVPVKFYPGIMFVDKKVFDTLNVPMPGQDWTWSEMISLIKATTVADSPDGMAYYGYGYLNRLDSYYGIASSQDIVGEFGYNGKTFDLSAWAVGEQEFADLRIGGYVAPNEEGPEMEAWTGEWEAWFGGTGHVGIIGESFWTFQDLWNTEAYEDIVDIYPYVIPAVSEEDASVDHHSIATIDFGGVSYTCEHPREAYELLKFMSFGVDGWMTRIELYSDTSMVNSSSLPFKTALMPAPITKDETVWNAYIEMFCDGMDEEHTEAWENYFASCMQPIPYGWRSIAGYWTFCDQYFNKIDIHTLVDNGTAKAADYMQEATEKANYFHAEAMVNYFGPSGYNFLSDEELAYYQAIVDAAGVVDGIE